MHHFSTFLPNLYTVCQDQPKDVPKVQDWSIRWRREEWSTVFHHLAIDIGSINDGHLVTMTAGDRGQPKQSMVSDWLRGTSLDSFIVPLVLIVLLGCDNMTDIILYDTANIKTPESLLHRCHFHLVDLLRSHLGWVPEWPHFNVPGTRRGTRL